MNKFIKVKVKLDRLKKKKAFELSIMFVILFSALIVGVKTFDLSSWQIHLFHFLDSLITILFFLEITIRLLAEKRFLNFFKDGWNIFDFIIVLISIIPIDGAEYSVIGRLLRIFRMLRMISLIPELKMIITALFKSMKSIAYVLLLMFIIYYIYAVIGTLLFHEVKSGLWDNVLISLLTLFRIMTFEDWTDVMYETMEIYPLSWAFHISFIFFTAFTFLNMIIGIIIETIHKENEPANDKNEINELKNEVSLLNSKIDLLIGIKTNGNI